MGKRRVISIIGFISLVLACNLFNSQPNFPHEDQDNSFRASVDANNTEMSSQEKTRTVSEIITQTKEAEYHLILTAIAIETQPASQDTESTATYKPTEPQNYLTTFRATENMFCRDGPAIYYESHTQVIIGQVVPVLARWINNDWLLVGIDDPPSPTRTRCCWVGGEGELNTNLSNIPTINYRPDRIDCPLYP